MDECLTNGLFYTGQPQASPMIKLCIFTITALRCTQCGEDPEGQLCEIQLRQNMTSDLIHFLKYFEIQIIEDNHMNPNFQKKLNSWRPQVECSVDDHV